MHNVCGDRATDHTRIDTFAGASRYKSRGIADQNGSALCERLHFVYGACRIERVVRVRNRDIGRNQFHLPRTFNETPHDLADIRVWPDSTADTHADVLALREHPPVSIEAAKSKRNEQWEFDAVEAFDGL